MIAGPMTSIVSVTLTLCISITVSSAIRVRVSVTTTLSASEVACATWSGNQVSRWTKEGFDSRSNQPEGSAISRAISCWRSVATTPRPIRAIP